LVAVVRSGGLAQCLPASDGSVLLPSAVHYVPAGCDAVGAQVLAMQQTDPLNSITSFKRWMGRGLADADTSRSPYRFLPREGLLAVETASGPRTAVEMSAEVLRTLVKRAEESLGGELNGAVVTVPAYFDDAQRQATKDAATLAGVRVLRLLNEPTAAAIAYGLDQGAEGVFLVYDLGGGTFDVSILRFRRGVFEVVATAGDSALGGDDFDQAIVDHWLAQRGLEVDALSSAQKHAWLAAARCAKEVLSSREEVSVNLADVQEHLQLRREVFEALSRGLLEKTMLVVRRALRDAGTDPAEIDGVILVGGATRMPQVRKALTRLINKPILDHLNPDEVVALGAALQASLLVGQFSADDDWLLLDVIPLSLGIETMGGLSEKIIVRNTTIPVQRAQEFTTFQDGQTGMVLHVVQGERELVRDCRSLARFELRGIPPMSAGAARIRVSFQVDADGLLSVTAEELRSGVSASIVVKPSYGLGDDEIVRMLHEGFEHAQRDVQARALKEQQVDAERMLLAVEAALVQDADLLSPQELHSIRHAIAALRECASREDHEAIRAAISALGHQTDHFAALRMDRAVSTALSGLRVDALG
jgi:molecular chaperone HscA